MDKKVVSLDEWLLDYKDYDIIKIIHNISTACKYISSKIKRAGIDNLYGDTSITNIHGEDVKTLDLISNRIFIKYLSSINSIAGLVSEEDKNILEINRDGRYLVTFDPLDGSSNIDANINVGSIFGIYMRNKDIPIYKDFLQAGKKMVVAGYCLYGCATMMVLTLGKGVTGFTLDETVGEFVVTHPSITIPKMKTIYSVNSGNYKLWSDRVKKIVDTLKSYKKPYTLRYIGSMVADVHRTLLYGGIFMYPKSNDAPNGKLRYLYEVAPLSYIIEKAGGLAYIDKMKALDFEPTDIHQRVPIYMGSKECLKSLNF